jgi:hypothetical protein
MAPSPIPDIEYRNTANFHVQRHIKTHVTYKKDTRSERKKYYYVFDFLCVLIKKETEQRRTPEMRKRAEMP